MAETRIGRSGSGSALVYGVVLAFLAVGATPCVAGGAADLWSAAWELETWGFHGAGTAIWVRDPSALRLDVALAGGVSPRDGNPWIAPWGQRGEGWTVVALVDGTGLIEVWGAQWRELDPFLAAMTRSLTRAVAEVSGASSGIPTRRRLVIPAGPDSRGYTSLRSELAARGLGQGGAGELVTLVPDPDRSRITVRSSRRPGRLTLALNWRGLGLDAVAPELFAPLWPLSDFLNFPAAIPEPGTDPGVELEAVPHGGQGPGDDR